MKRVDEKLGKGGLLLDTSSLDCGRNRASDTTWEEHQPEMIG
jgi:hypothetical protein